MIAKTHKRKNFPLPPGAVMLPKPIRRKIGGWVKMEYDAKLRRHGLTWFRVKDGFGGKGDCEDWVGNVPLFCLSVSDYQWRPPYFGLFRYGSMEDAMLGELKECLEDVQSKVVELRRDLKWAERVLARMSKFKDIHVPSQAALH